MPSSPPGLAPLLSRYSLGVKHLTDPAPDAAQLQSMLAAALRAPDHAELVPFRFVVVQGDARQRLADLFAEHAHRKGKDAEGVAMERERALRAPMTVAVLARIDLGHPLVPAHEQWMCVGGAVTNFLNAAHVLGFAGKMLSGDKARAPHIAQAFCEPGETLVGWVALGTPTRTPHGEARKDTTQALRFW
ncbi:nitroreductase [Rhodoferax sp. TH121]|uniref:nitroreductase family protein n=1 Tax=Rhodoferax sp. TH121 TaxID=2022803 RepID=UPI000B97C118|nr:nitroreductase [Rhodoferax sp. TH121]OYQ39698.1 nitroreductase [Rhodoferax sp. TH121]